MLVFFLITLNIEHIINTCRVLLDVKKKNNVNLSELA